MPTTRILLYQEEDGTIPLLDWFRDLPNKAVIKCRTRMDRLAEQGYEIRRPIGDYLGDGIYELRALSQGIHYRILYFFYENTAVILSHGLTKEKNIPSKEIEYAIERKIKFQKNPDKHSYEEVKS